MCLLEGNTEERAMQRNYVRSSSNDSNERDIEAMGRLSQRAQEKNKKHDEKSKKKRAASGEHEEQAPQKQANK